MWAPYTFRYMANYRSLISTIAADVSNEKVIHIAPIITRLFLLKRSDPLTRFRSEPKKARFSLHPRFPIGQRRSLHRKKSRALTQSTSIRTIRALYNIHTFDSGRNRYWAKVMEEQRRGIIGE